MIYFFNCLTAKTKDLGFLKTIVLCVYIASINGCSYLQNLFASSASSASMGSLSASSGSSAISDSVKSLISSPSDKLQTDERYNNEVADYAYAFITFPPAKDDYLLFKQGLGKIAIRSGIIDWENNPKTYLSIGKGLKKANLKGAEFKTYKKKLGNSDYARMLDIQKGYDSR